MRLIKRSFHPKPANRLSAMIVVGLALLILGNPSLSAAPEASPEPITPKAVRVEPEQLNQLIAALPEATQSTIRQNPVAFLTLIRKSLAETSDLVILVDKEHYLDSHYAPSDLVNLDTISGSFVRNRHGLQLRLPAANALATMAAAAKKDRVTLDVSSCYRSFATQVAVFGQEVKDYGQQQAERESARAGASQHQLGTAIDFGSITPSFANTAAGKWLALHAWQFGYSLSYPEGYEPFTGYLYEAWHYRFVGIYAAQLIHDYFGDLQQAGLLFLHNQNQTLRTLLAL